MRQNLESKYGSKNKTNLRKKKPNNNNFKRKYNEFLKKNHKDIDRLYENIRKNLQKNSIKLGEIRKNDPILILQEDIKESKDQDRLFG